MKYLLKTYVYNRTKKRYCRSIFSGSTYANLDILLFVIQKNIKIDKEKGFKYKYVIIEKEDK